MFIFTEILILYIPIKCSADKMREPINGTVFAFTFWMELFIAGIAKYAEKFYNLFPVNEKTVVLLYFLNGYCRKVCHQYRLLQVSCLEQIMIWKCYRWYHFRPVGVSCLPFFWTSVNFSIFINWVRHFLVLEVPGLCFQLYYKLHRQPCK